MDVIDLTEPAIEPVSLTQAKLFLRVDHAEEDGLILDMIKAARLQIEAFCGVSLVSRMRRISFACLAGKDIVINHYPVSSIDAVRSVDKAGDETGLTAADYSVNLRARPARLCLDIAAPLSSEDHLEIDVTAGYGPSPDDIPAPFTQSILLLTAQLYERGDERPENIPLMVQALLMPYRGLRL